MALHFSFRSFVTRFIVAGAVLAALGLAGGLASGTAERQVAGLSTDRKITSLV